MVEATVRAEFSDEVERAVGRLAVFEGADDVGVIEFCGDGRFAQEAAGKIAGVGDIGAEGFQRKGAAVGGAHQVDRAHAAFAQLAFDGVLAEGPGHEAALRANTQTREGPLRSACRRRGARPA